MPKNFVRVFLMVSVLIGLTACLKKTSRKDIDIGLMAAMTRTLNSEKNVDTSKVKFTVMNVTYFEEKETFACEFKVNMKTPNIDTTGMMSANISKDYTRVFRKN